MKKLLCAVLLAAAILVSLTYILSGIMPVHRGVLIDKRYTTYWVNCKGPYYISLGEASQLNLFNHGTFGYLSPSPHRSSFVVLSDDFAKDDQHVWVGYDLLSGADAATFTVHPSGLAKDKHHVFVYHEGGWFGPFQGQIDVSTAEYFVFAHNGQDWTWVRDKDHVYLDERIQDVDRATFHWDDNLDLFVDKNHQYDVWWDSDQNRCILHTMN